MSIGKHSALAKGILSFGELGETQEQSAITKGHVQSVQSVQSVEFSSQTETYYSNSKRACSVQSVQSVQLLDRNL